jgi:hypothetical protein
MDWTKLVGAPWQAALLGLAAVLIVLLAGRRLRRHRPPPLVVRPALLEPVERGFLAALQRAAGKGFRVWPHVHAAAVLDVRRSAPRRRRRAALRRLSDVRLDYVLSRTGDTRPIAVIQLHRGNRSGPSAALAEACEAARLPLLELPAGERPDPDSLQAILQPYLDEAQRPAETAAGGGERREPIIDLPPD